MRKYAVFFFGGNEQSGGRYDAGWYNDEDDIGENERDPSFAESASDYRAALRRAQELNRENGFPIQ